MTTKKVFTFTLFILIGFILTCACFAIAFQSNGNNTSGHSEAPRINTHYELPKLIPAAWYVGK